MALLQAAVITTLVDCGASTSEDDEDSTSGSSSSSSSSSALLPFSIGEGNLSTWLTVVIGMILILAFQLLFVIGFYFWRRKKTEEVELLMRQEISREFEEEEEGGLRVVDHDENGNLVGEGDDEEESYDEEEEYYEEEEEDEGFEAEDDQADMMMMMHSAAEEDHHAEGTQNSSPDDESLNNTKTLEDDEMAEIMQNPLAVDPRVASRSSSKQKHRRRVLKRTNSVTSTSSSIPISDDSESFSSPEDGSFSTTTNDSPTTSENQQTKNNKKQQRKTRKGSRTTRHRASSPMATTATKTASLTFDKDGDVVVLEDHDHDHETEIANVCRTSSSVDMPSTLSDQEHEDQAQQKRRSEENDPVSSPNVRVSNNNSNSTSSMLLLSPAPPRAFEESGNVSVKILSPSQPMSMPDTNLDASLSHRTKRSSNNMRKKSVVFFDEDQNRNFSPTEQEAEEETSVEREEDEEEGKNGGNTTKTDIIDVPTKRKSNSGRLTSPSTSTSLHQYHHQNKIEASDELERLKLKNKHQAILHRRLQEQHRREREERRASGRIPSVHFMEEPGDKITYPEEVSKSVYRAIPVPYPGEEWQTSLKYACCMARFPYVAMLAGRLAFQGFAYDTFYLLSRFSVGSTQGVAGGFGLVFCISWLAIHLYLSDYIQKYELWVYREYNAAFESIPAFIPRRVLPNGFWHNSPFLLSFRAAVDLYMGKERLLRHLQWGTYFRMFLIGLIVGVPTSAENCLAVYITLFVIMWLSALVFIIFRPHRRPIDDVVNVLLSFLNGLMILFIVRPELGVDSNEIFLSIVYIALCSMIFTFIYAACEFFWWNRLEVAVAETKELRNIDDERKAREKEIERRWRELDRLHELFLESEDLALHFEEEEAKFRRRIKRVEREMRIKVTFATEDEDKKEAEKAKRGSRFGAADGTGIFSEEAREAKKLSRRNSIRQNNNNNNDSNITGENEAMVDEERLEDGVAPEDDEEEDPQQSSDYARLREIYGTGLPNDDVDNFLFRNRYYSIRRQRTLFEQYEREQQERERQRQAALDAAAVLQAQQDANNRSGLSSAASTAEPDIHSTFYNDEIDNENDDDDENSETSSITSLQAIRRMRLTNRRKRSVRIDGMNAYNNQFYNSAPSTSINPTQRPPNAANDDQHGVVDGNNNNDTATVFSSSSGNSRGPAAVQIDGGISMRRRGGGGRRNGGFSGSAVERARLAATDLQTDMSDTFVHRALDVLGFF